MHYARPEDPRVQQEDNNKARTNRKLAGYLAPTVIRILALLVISVAFIIWGFKYLSSVSASSVAQSGGLYASELGPPDIFLVANSHSLKAVVTKAVLSATLLSIDLRVTAPPSSDKKPNELTVYIYGAQPTPHSGWSSFGDSMSDETINVPAGLSVKHFHIPLTNCSCYEYKAPYLVAAGLGPTDVASQIPGLTYPGPGPTDNAFSPVIEQDVLDLSNVEDLGGVFSLSISSYPPVQQLGSAAIWQWQNVSSPQLVSFVAESASGKEAVDNRTFKAGLLLGIGGSGIIVIVDHLFDLWRETREYRDDVSKRKEKLRRR
jgi:hypothetical protein